MKIWVKLPQGTDQMRPRKNPKGSRAGKHVQLSRDGHWLRKRYICNESYQSLNKATPDTFEAQAGNINRHNTD